MSRICLIRCPSPFLIEDKVFPPLGLLAVGTVWAEEGHEVLVYDGPPEGVPKGYDRYGLGPTTPEFPVAQEIAKGLDGEVVFGGPHVGWYLDYGDAIIDRSLVDIKSYKYYIDGKLATTVVTAVGCPYKCAFCSKGPAFKAREVGLVIREIEMLRRDFGYEALMFFDDTFVLSRERVLELCACLRALGIVWRCFVRADLVLKHGEGLLRIMKDSGCVEVGMGIESGSDKILAGIDKGETSGQIRRAVEMLRRAGIRVKGFLIVGLPGESMETLDETRSFLDQAKLDCADFTVFKPYPGSPIWQHRDDYDISWGEVECSEMFYKGKPGEYKSLVRTAALTADEIVAARNGLEAEYGSVDCYPSS